MQDKTMLSNHAVCHLSSTSTQRGGRSTVNVCALDIVKAFDKVNHYCLYTKLIRKKVPVQFLDVIINWYSKCFASVEWNNILSGSFRLRGGVR